MPAGGEPLRQDARAVLDVILVAPAAIDVDAAQRLEAVAELRDEIDRVVLAPFAPALFDDLARFEVEGNAEAERRFSIRIVKWPPCKGS